ncbi:DUF6115 domain-containing protein [Candidatus Epulonipiscium viviparus]|uniref:DUF6115 domain-containing protein n=1 Tax=Candidatus Epulonipiscium viviparus TaxID=420336 RepID=UPI0004952883|nr:hypothetical protein [Candidatus Epulopiscium viviparus]
MITGWILIGVGIVIIVVSIYKIVDSRRNEMQDQVEGFSPQQVLKEPAPLTPQAKSIFKPNKGFDLASDVAHKSRIFEELKEEDQKVLYLANQGYSVTKIAKELNRGKGEIELILSLYRKES